MTGAQRAAPFQNWPVRLLFDMEVRFDRNRFPTAHWVDGDFFIFRTRDRRRGGEGGDTEGQTEKEEGDRRGV